MEYKTILNFNLYTTLKTAVIEINVRAINIVVCIRKEYILCYNSSNWVIYFTSVLSFNHHLFQQELML